MDRLSDYFRVRSAYAGMNIHDVPINDIEDTILKILEEGYGYNIETLIKNTAKYGYDWQRTGKNIKARINTAINRLLSKEAITIENGVLKAKEQ